MVSSGSHGQVRSGVACCGSLRQTRLVMARCATVGLGEVRLVPRGKPTKPIVIRIETAVLERLQSLFPDDWRDRIKEAIRKLSETKPKK